MTSEGLIQSSLYPTEKRPLKGLKWQNSHLSGQFSNEHMTVTQQHPPTCFSLKTSQHCVLRAPIHQAPLHLRMRRVANIGQAAQNWNTSFSASTQPGTQAHNLLHSDSLKKGVLKLASVPSKRSNSYFQTFVFLFQVSIQLPQKSNHNMKKYFTLPVSTGISLYSLACYEKSF